MYLGVDGGGSKTALAVISREGTLLATHLASGASYFSAGAEALAAFLYREVEITLQKAQIAADDLEFAFFGLPGYGEDAAATAAMDQMPSRSLPAGSYSCANDMICGWAGSLVCSDGISVVAGTGSICYGERGGVGARVGGWSELFGDEGSAYWIVIRALNLFSRMSDGRTAVGPFHDHFKRRVGIEMDLHMCGFVHGRLAGDRALIAQLCSVVADAAASGDHHASFIFQEAAAELALMVDSTRQRLGFSAKEPVAVSYTGGVFENSGGLLFESFRSSLQLRETDYRIGAPAFPPMIGAALYAAKCQGRPLSGAALLKLRKQCLMRGLRAGAQEV